MSLFIQSLVALAASVSAAPADVQHTAQPAALVAIEAQGDIDLADNLVSKLDSVTPRAEENRIKIWGESWPQHTWAEIQPHADGAPDGAAQMSATEAFRQISE